MSRFETSPTSTRPARTANFIRIPLIGIPGLSDIVATLSSLPVSPVSEADGVSSLAISKEGQVAVTGKAPVQPVGGHTGESMEKHLDMLLLPG